MYLNSINHFRGIAIIWIVLPHCQRFSEITYDTVFTRTIGNLIQGGSFFFVFVSGFLFHHIFFPKFDFSVFLIRKLKFVLLPYLIMSVIFMFIYVLISDLSFEKISFYLERIFYFLVTGKHLVPYWYIPFIMILFALSPLFVRFIKLPLKTQLLITLILLSMSILTDKPRPSIFNALNRVLFYSPVYLFGMVCSQSKEWIYTNFHKKEYYLLCIVIILALIQVSFQMLGENSYNAFEYGGVNLQPNLLIVQKIVFCIFFLVWLQRFENVELKLLNLIAVNSFGIYFVHQFFIKGLFAIKYNFNLNVPSNAPMFYGLVTTVVVVISLISVLILKKMAPKYSRFIVGS